ncbi:MAG: phosphotransferase [Pseudomonadota bacterium]
MTTAFATRDDLITTFLAQAGHGAAVVSPLAGDASNRRYLRVAAGGRQLVLMDAPAEKGEDVRPFVAMTEWLRGHGHSAPQILAADVDQGFLLLEDLGEALFARAIAEGTAPEHDLYAAAVDLLAVISAHPVPATIGTGPATLPLATYDQAVLRREALLMPDWWMTHAAATPPSPDQTAEFTALIDAGLADIGLARDCVVMRDYHAENLIWLPDRPGTARVGVLDYQDALAGHAAYDLVSLLEDARRDTSPALRTAMMERYLDRRGDLERDAFHRAYAALGAQRNLKIVGIFARLAVRDAKPRYLDLIPRVWDHLMRDLAHPALSDLAAWIAAHVPPPSREALARVGQAAPR